MAGSPRAGAVGRRSSFQCSAGSFFPCPRALQQWSVGANICRINLESDEDPFAVVALVIWALAGGPGELQLCPVSHSHSSSHLISALPMDHLWVLSGIPGPLCRVECPELPLLRDAGSSLVTAAVSSALNAKYNRGDLKISSWQPPVHLTGAVATSKTPFVRGMAKSLIGFLCWRLRTQTGSER